MSDLLVPVRLPLLLLLQHKRHSIDPASKARRVEQERSHVAPEMRAIEARIMVHCEAQVNTMDHDKSEKEASVITDQGSSE